MPDSPHALGDAPLSPGRALGDGWTVASTTAGGGKARVIAHHRAHGAVEFVLMPSVPGMGSNPFDASGVAIYFEPTPVPFNAFSAAGEAIGRLAEQAGRSGGGQEIISRLIGRPRADLEGGADLGARARVPAFRIEEVAGAPDIVAAALAEPGRVELTFETAVDLGALTPTEVEQLAALGARAQMVVRVPVQAGLSDLAAERLGRLARCSVAVRVETHLKSHDARAALALLTRVRHATGDASATVTFLADPDTPPSAAALRPLTAAIASGPAWSSVFARLHLPFGAPLCFEPRRLLDALRRPRDAARDRGVYAEPCSGCAVRGYCPGFEGAAPAGMRELVSPFLSRLPAATVPPHWTDVARWTLYGQQGVGLALTDLIDPRELPERPCILPWRHLKRTFRGEFTPCHVEYPRQRHIEPAGASIGDLWNAPALQAFRVAMTTGGHPSTCKESCPVLLGRGAAIETARLLGGAPEVVDNQIAAIEAALNGTVVVDGLPDVLILDTTSYCNYDCLMCDFPEIGRLDDERDERAYAELRATLPRCRELNFTGGEPLASPNFRRFLASITCAEFPDVGIGLNTNASYLTPAQMEIYRDTPFRALTISLNGATARTYEAVNRGLTFERIRRNLDAILEWRRSTVRTVSLAYSMVILRANLAEISEFAELAWTDGAEVRFLLPYENRNNQNFLGDVDLVRRVVASLESVLATIERTPALGSERHVRGTLDALRRHRAGGRSAE